jgi:hypothetical protein
MDIDATSGIDRRGTISAFAFALEGGVRRSALRGAISRELNRRCHSSLLPFVFTICAGASSRTSFGSAIA